MNRKYIVLQAVLCIFMISLFFSGCSMKLNTGEDEKKDEIRIGVLLYNGDDLFLSVMRQKLDETFREAEKNEDCKITVNFCDAKGSQLVQNDQINKFISQNYDVLCVNLVDRTDAATIVDKGKKADVPIVFFNREPVSADMKLWDKTYYVGVKSQEGGEIQSKIILEQYKKDKKSIDTNGDGVIQYVLLEGEPGHQDTTIRTEYCIKTMKENGMKLERLATDNANWRRTQGREKMAEWLQTFGNRIELVISNNDEMALGALDAMDEANIPSGSIHIIGLDGVEEAKEAVKSGRMLGTVINDAQGQVNAVVQIAISLGKDETPLNVPYMDTNRIVSVPHQMMKSDSFISEKK